MCVLLDIIPVEPKRFHSFANQAVQFGYMLAECRGRECELADSNRVSNFPFEKLEARRSQLRGHGAVDQGIALCVIYYCFDLWNDGRLPSRCKQRVENGGLVAKIQPSQDDRSVLGGELCQLRYGRFQQNFEEAPPGEKLSVVSEELVAGLTKLLQIVLKFARSFSHVRHRSEGRGRGSAAHAGYHARQAQAAWLAFQQGQAEEAVVRGDLRIALLLFGTFALTCAAMGADWLLALLNIVARWLLAWPAPSKEFSEVLAAWAWPSAILILSYILRRPLRIAAHNLSKRFEKDRISVGNGLLEIDAATSLIPLNQAERDSQVKEALWEYGGSSQENWNRLVAWLTRNGFPSVEVEDFLSEAIFASERETAYKELTEGR